MWSWWSKEMLANVAIPFPFSIRPSWHPFARQAASFTLAFGRGWYSPVAYFRVVTVMKTGEKEWHLMHVTPACLDAFHCSTYGSM